MEVAPAELEWPKVKFPLKTDPIFDEILSHARSFTPEEIAAAKERVSSLSEEELDNRAQVVEELKAQLLA